MEFEELDVTLVILGVDPLDYHRLIAIDDQGNRWKCDDAFLSNAIWTRCSPFE